MTTHRPPTPGEAPRPDPAARLRGRIGAYVQHANHDPHETTAAARAAFLSRFECEVDPDNVLDLAERRRRAQAARKAYFARLALRSAQVRRQRASKEVH